jgi:hypothetical protein
LLVAVGHDAAGDEQQSATNQWNQVLVHARSIALGSFGPAYCDLLLMIIASSSTMYAKL